jgi:signal transduction histidine kinase
VSSTGEPIDDENLALLFEPLRRGDTPGNTAGLGLGLYIVSEIVKAHGGTVGARSAGRLTVFTVTLPRGGLGAQQSSPPAA